MQRQSIYVSRLRKDSRYYNSRSEYGKIFPNISYVGMDSHGVQFGSDSIVFNVTPKNMIEISLDDYNPVDLEYAISNSNLRFVYYSR
jgi:hypothetical protein